MTWGEVADAVFRANDAWLRENMPPDFPQPDRFRGLFHVEAVEAWARQHWGIASQADSPENVTARVREQIHARRQAPVASSGDESHPAAARHHGEQSGKIKGEPPNYRVATLARRWNCSQGKVRALLAKGALPHFRVGTLVRIRSDDVHAYEEQCRVEAEPAAVTPSMAGAATLSRDGYAYLKAQKHARRFRDRKAP